MSKKLRLIATEPTADKLGDRNVNMREELVMAVQGFKTLTEKRVMAACVAKLDSVSLDNHGRYRIKLTADEYASTYHSVDKDKAYELLKRTMRVLRQREFRYARKDGRHTRECVHSWVTGAEYLPKTGTVEVFFNVEATPLLLNLRGKYAGYLLKQAADLRSLTSWRLLEMLSRYKDTGWFQVSVDDFAKAMEAKQTYLKNFAQLRRWIIEPAVKELTGKDGWLIKWQPIKEGRKVTALRFEFKRDPQGRLPV